MTEVKETKKTIYETLRSIDVSEHIEKKNGLSYVSWAWAWDTLMKVYPKSTVKVVRNADGRFWHDDGRTGWVEVSVTVTDGEETIERSELFPIMDYKNNSIPAEKITSFNANTAIQRATTKAIARHGLGLYVYAGEDLPPDAEENEPAGGNISENTAENAAEAHVTEAQLKMLARYSENDATKELLTGALKTYGAGTIEELTLTQASLILKAFAKKGM